MRVTAVLVCLFCCRLLYVDAAPLLVPGRLFGWNECMMTNGYKLDVAAAVFCCATACTVGVGRFWH
jgi:hypothetical protein